MTLIAYSYARFSSPAQAHGDSVRRQMEAAEHYAAEHDLILDTSLRDHGVSAYRGAHRTTGALSRFLENVVAGRIAEGSYLLLDSFDRLSREHPTEALGLLLDITRRGVAVVFLSSGKIFGRQTEPTDLMWALFESTRSHNESLEKGRKLAAVRAQERKRAREDLTPFTPAGPHWLSLTTDANGKKSWAKIPERVAVVQQVFDMKESGLGYAAIARKMNEVPVPTARPRKGRPGVWSEATVSDLIYSRAVLGEYAPHKGHRTAGKREPDGLPIPGFYPQIIEPDQFHRVHAMIRTRQNPNAQPRSRLFKNLLVGQAICGACGGTVGFHQSTTRPTRTGEIRGALRCNNVNRGACENRHRLPYKDVERDLMPFLAALSAAQAAIPAQAVSVQELARARMNREALQTRIDALLDALEEGRGVSGRLAEREAEADALDREIADLEREAAIERAQAAAPDWRDRLEEIRRQMETAEGDALYDARAALSALVAVAVPGGFEFRDGLLFARFNERHEDHRRRLYFGAEGGVIRWEFGPGAPTFDQVRSTH